MTDERIDTQRRMRSDLVEMLSRELLGPFDGPHETLAQRPTGRYLLGRLAPAGTMVGPEEDDGAVLVLPVSAPLDLSGELPCDWREGDLW